MPSLPRLTEADIQRWAGDTSLERGRPYTRSDSLFNQRHQGFTLKAQCQGSLPQPYRVTATLEEQGVGAASCTCPVGGGGRCKHVAALLLAWVEDPATFVEVEDLDAALDRRTKAELIALIRQMMARYPDLETLIELPIPSGGKGQKSVNQDLIRRQARNAFAGDIYEWGAAYGIAQSLEGLVRLGEGYVQAQDWRNAAIIYETVAKETLERYEEVDDEGGELGEVVSECVAGLGECLSAATDPVQRETILHAIFDVYRWDVDFGGIGIGDEAPGIILDNATTEERQRVVGWVRSAMPSGGSWSDDYHRQSYGGLLLSLQGDQLDDESFLRICRETGRTRDLVTRLLALGRLDEALAAVRGVPDTMLLTFADLLRASGHADPAERLVRERAAHSQDYQMTAWLKQRALERGDLAEALALAETLFWRGPGLPDYNEIKHLAQESGQWEQLRPTIIMRLERDSNYTLLTEIHLHEGNIEQALKTLSKATHTVGFGVAPLAIRVAQAAEERRPADSIRIYTDSAKRLIQQQGRDNYTTAARYLARVRDLHQRLGEPKTWLALIADIRQQNKRLRALQEELTRAGL